MLLFSLMLLSCVADNALGRAKKYIEVSGRPGPAQFHSPLYSRSRDVYNLTWSVESVPKLEEIRILYRKLMVSYLTEKHSKIFTRCSGSMLRALSRLSYSNNFVILFLISNPIKVFIASHVIHILRLHLYIPA
jgi:hypothetical protein